MKTRIIAFAASLALLSGASSCATRTRAASTESKNTTYEVKISKDFQGISVANNIEVDYQPSNVVKLSITTPADNRENVNVTVKDNILVLTCNNNKKTFVSPKVKVTLSAPTLREFKGMNNAEIKIAGNYNVDNLKITMVNNADIEFSGAVTTTLSEFTATNNAEITFTNLSADNVVVTAVNNAEVKAKNLKATTVTASATNNAEIDLAGKAITAALSATNNAEVDASKLVVNAATCSAANLATVKANAENIASNTSNHGTVKNTK